MFAQYEFNNVNGRGLNKVDEFEMLDDGFITCCPIFDNALFLIDSLKGLPLCIKNTLKIIERLKKSSDKPLYGCELSFSSRFIKPKNKIAVDMIPIIHSWGPVNVDGISMFEMHPSVEEFYRFCERVYFFGGWIDERYIDLINQELIELKLTLCSYKHKLRVDNFVRAAEKNNLSLIRYVNELFDKHARLLVVRVDFSYKNDCASRGEIDHILRHREQLLRDRRNSKCLKSIVGYAWKIEYAVTTGYHIHFIAFYDGSKFKSDMNLAKMIGEEWLMISNGDGRYHNCNRHKSRYINCGIGDVKYSDKEKRASLGLALKYMTKPDKFLRIKHNQKRRTFGRGASPATDKYKAGRKRLA